MHIVDVVYIQLDFSALILMFWAQEFREAFALLNAQRSLVPEQLAASMFPNIDSIYRLHLQLLRELHEPEDA